MTKSVGGATVATKEIDPESDHTETGTTKESAIGVGIVILTPAVGTETGPRVDTVNGTVSATGIATATTATIATGAENA